MITGVGRAERIDAATGVREVVEFFGDGPDRLFGIRYTPTHVAATCGVVICEPLLSQFIAHYRYGTLMARRLAAWGLAVQRFHYRSTGNSDGDVRRLSVESMGADTLLAADVLRAATGVDRVAFLGVQIGGYPAAFASRSGAPVVLDSPPATGRDYLKNAFRSHAVVMMQSGVEAVSRDVLTDELDQEGVVTLLGARLSNSLYRSLEDKSLLAELGGGDRPVLLVGASLDGELKPAVARLRTQIVQAGFDLETIAKRREDPFWYVDHAAPEDHKESAELVVEIGEWIRRRLGASHEDADG